MLVNRELLRDGFTTENHVGQPFDHNSGKTGYPGIRQQRSHKVRRNAPCFPLSLVLHFFNCLLHLEWCYTGWRSLESFDGLGGASGLGEST